MATPMFFDEIIEITKNAQTVNHQLEKDADVLTKHLERKIKQTIKHKASLGETFAVIDLNIFHVDFASKFTVPQLLFTKITDSYVPVAHRMFKLNGTPFKNFIITETDKNVFKIDWTHGIVKQEPLKNRTMYKPNIAPPTNVHVDAPTSNICYGHIQPPTEQEVQAFLSSLFPYVSV